MTDYKSIVIREGLSFGEGPRWHEGRLWYSDFYRRGIYSIKPDASDERLEVNVPTQPSGLDWASDGYLYFVSMIDHTIRRFANGTESIVLDFSEHCGFWANDMVLSANDVGYVGNFGFDLDRVLHEVGLEGLLASPPPTTNLVVFNTKGEILQIIPGMAFPNGSVITPDGKTLILGETLAFKLTAFDIAANGTLSNRRVWAQLDFVATDGMCLDVDGQIWLANALRSECLRVKKGGEITGRVTTTQTAFACMLGGNDGRDLFIMTAPSSDRFKVADRTDGKIEVAKVAACRAGRP